MIKFCYSLEILISAPSLSTFRQRLKTFLFQASFLDIIIDPHHHHLFAQYADMISKIYNVPDRKANSFSSNNCP